MLELLEQQKQCKHVYAPVKAITAVQVRCMWDRSLQRALYFIYYRYMSTTYHTQYAIKHLLWRRYIKYVGEENPN